MDKKPRLGSDPLEWIRHSPKKKEGEEMKRILLTVLFFIGIIFFLFANSYAASTKEEYELQERCGKRAEEVFRKEYENRNIGESWMSNYTNHYNRKLNKCFILVTSNFFPDKKFREEYGIQTDKTLWDINEYKYYGEFVKFSKSGVSYCEVLGKRCSSENEWDSLVKPYMEE